MAVWSGAERDLGFVVAMASFMALSASVPPGYSEGAGVLEAYFGVLMPSAYTLLPAHGGGLFVLLPTPRC